MLFVIKEQKETHDICVINNNILDKFELNAIRDKVKKLNYLVLIIKEKSLKQIDYNPIMFALKNGSC